MWYIVSYLFYISKLYQLSNILNLPYPIFHRAPASSRGQARRGWAAAVLLRPGGRGHQVRVCWGLSQRCGGCKVREVGGDGEV